MKLIDVYLLTGFFLIASILILFAGKMRKTAEGKYIVCVNALIIFAFSLFYRMQTKNGILFIISNWAPLFLIFYFYKSAGLLSRSFYNDTFDNVIINFEKKIFGDYNPFIWLSNKFNFFWLSEYLHLCYFSYFLLLYAIPFYLYFKHDYNLFYQFEFAELLVLLQSFLIHSMIPVLSPRTLFEKISLSLRKGPIYRLVHYAVENGSADGTAFPSTHVGIGTLVILTALYFHTPFFLMLLPFAIGLVVSTIYGRFHYITDLTGGVIIASISFFLVYH